MKPELPELRVGDRIIDHHGYQGVVYEIKEVRETYKSGHLIGYLIMVRLDNPPHSNYRTSGYWPHDGLRRDVLGEMASL